MGKGGLVRYNAGKWAGFGLIFQSEGAVFSLCLPNAIAAAVVAAGLQSCGYGPDPASKELTFAYGIVGLALSFSLVTRAGTCYERFWEGRDLLATIQARV